MGQLAGASITGVSLASNSLALALGNGTGLAERQLLSSSQLADETHVTLVEVAKALMAKHW